MRKVFILEGLSCSNCAARIEKDVQNLSYVRDVNYNLVNCKLTVDLREEVSNLGSDITRVVNKYEPDVGVVPEEEAVKMIATEAGSEIQIFILFGIGILSFILGFVVRDFSVSLVLFVISYLLFGWDVLWKAIRNIFKGQVFDENFLMSVATLGAFAIGAHPEAVGVMLFYQIGEYFQDRAVARSKQSIIDLMNIRPDYANIEMDGRVTQVDPVTLLIGDVILVQPGEKIPLDGSVVEGESLVDQSVLTGEFLPVRVESGSEVLSGSINKNGVLRVKVTKLFEDSAVSKIIDLVENASSKKAKTENFITTFSRYYTPVVVGLAVLLAFVPPLLGFGAWGSWIYRALIFLVISCPCALVVSVPLSYFSGIGAASSRGILVKGSNYLEALSDLKTVVFDKTGTLTEGVFKVIHIDPAEDISITELIEYAAYAEGYSNHPIAMSIKEEYGQEIDMSRIGSFTDKPGLGVGAVIDNKFVLIGNFKLMKEHNIKYVRTKTLGTEIYIAADGKFIGSIIIADVLKEDSLNLVNKLKMQDIERVAMLTGDNRNYAEEIGREVGIKEIYAELLPQEKVEILEDLESEQKDGRLAFVGDGINDAPALALADVGISMGGIGTDAAIEASDVVLMTDEVSKVNEAVIIAKRTKRIVVQNIVFALAIKFLFLILGAMGLVNLWEAVFADVGVTIMAVLNALRIRGDGFGTWSI